MNELLKLRDMLCKELEGYGSKGEMSTGTLDVVDKLAHAVKNLDKIIESYDGEYSGRYYADGMGGVSYARRRDSMGRYSRRYNDGYSRHGDMAEELRALMQDAPDERTRMEIQRLVEKLER